MVDAQPEHKGHCTSGLGAATSQFKTECHFPDPRRQVEVTRTGLAVSYARPQTTLACTAVARERR